MKNFKENITDLARLAILSAILLAGMSFAQSWTPAGCEPPNCNVSAPINISVASQQKAGPLIVGGLGVIGGLTIKDGTNTAVGKVLTLTNVSTGAAQWVTPNWVSKNCPSSAFSAVNGAYCIEKNQRSALTYYNAVTACSLIDSHVCSPDEWVYACTRTGIGLTGMTDGWEWTSDSVDLGDTFHDGRVRIGNGSCTTLGHEGVNSSMAFRCCFNR